MKRILIMLVVLVLFFSNFAMAETNGGAEENVIKTEAVVAKVKASITKWQILYYKELLRSIALEYTGLCFKDKRWINANQEIERLDREVKQFLKNDNNLKETK